MTDVRTCPLCHKPPGQAGDLGPRACRQAVAEAASA